MRATGIVRRVDDLGRVVIPMEIRRRLRIRDGDALELFVLDDGVCYKKYDYFGDNVKFTVQRAMRTKEYALYNTNERICVQAATDEDGNKFPALVSDEWAGTREVVCKGDYIIYHIISEGVLHGYLSVPRGEDDGFVRGVVCMVAAMMED